MYNLRHHTHFRFVHNILLQPEQKKTAVKTKVWNIKEVKKQLGPELCKNIPFLHAVLGCDTMHLPTVWDKERDFT